MFAGFSSMFSKMFSGASGMGGGGGQQRDLWDANGNLNLPFLSNIAGGLLEHEKLKNIGKGLHTQFNLQKRAISKEQRKVVGGYLADVGASGVEPTLEIIAEREKEYELDKAILKDQYRRQRHALDMAGDKARIQGFVNAGVEALGGMFNTKAPKQEPPKNTMPVLGANSGNWMPWMYGYKQG